MPRRKRSFQQHSACKNKEKSWKCKLFQLFFLYTFHSHSIVEGGFEESIHNLTSIGANAMCKTDDMILNIMTSKQSK